MPLNSREHFEEEVKVRQRNTIWPDTLRNGLSVDKLLWKGSATATPTQRVGTGIFGFAFLIAAVSFGGLAYRQRSEFLAFFTLPWIYVGSRIFLNAFRRK